MVKLSSRFFHESGPFLYSRSVEDDRGKTIRSKIMAPFMSNDEKTYWTINRDFFGRSGPRWTKKTFQIVLNATNGDGVNATTKLPLQVENEMLKNQVVCFLSLSLSTYCIS